MQLKREIEYQSSTETTNCSVLFYLDWPLDKNSNQKLIVACDTCYYPITFEEHVLDEIRDENNISFGIVIPFRSLFKRVGILLEDPLDQWRTEVFCPNCGVILSFLSPHRSNLSVANFTKIVQYMSFDEQIVILWTYPLFRGSEVEAYNRFTQLNQ